MIITTSTYSGTIATSINALYFIGNTQVRESEYDPIAYLVSMQTAHLHCLLAGINKESHIALVKNCWREREPTIMVGVDEGAYLVCSSMPRLV